MLDDRSLNRALLARQMLLERAHLPAMEAVERLVALQAQVPRDPYVALWSRLAGFRPEELSSAMEARRAVRMTLLRGTLHLVTARDAAGLRPLLQPAVERLVLGSSPLRRIYRDVDLGEVLAAFGDLLEERPRARAELVAASRERWPDRDADQLGYAMYLLPTVQVTPRGLWGRSGRSAFTTLEAWLGRSQADTRSTPEDLALRYLGAFGPASAADLRTWSGLPSSREIMERLRPGLRTFRDERGHELFDVPDAPLPAADTPAPVRFLPEYDNLVLAHADRRRMAPEGISAWTEVGWGTLLVDGFVTARWKLLNGKGRAQLRVEPFQRLTPSASDDVVREGELLLAFLVGGSGGEVRLIDQGQASTSSR